ncbi:MAG TPA: MoaD/ThiS family protein [Acidimicrobiia bacterium]|nr:MoaD/ThiS family protein [Acidimicrobiia bacterium]
MATVRLFARLKELAGSSRVEIDGGTVGEVVAAAGDRFGPEFVAAVETARVWRNGEEAQPSDAIDAGDEVAILPPVSGGAAAITARPEVAVAAPLLVALVIVFVNLQGDAAWWAAALVGVAGLWIIDLAGQIEARGRSFPAIGVLVGAVAGAVITESIGATGLAVAIAAAVMIVLTWGVGIAGYRSVDTVAPGVMVGLLAAAAVGSLILARSSASPDTEAVDVFLVVVILAVLLGSVVERMAQLPYLDPFTVTALTAIVAAVAMAFFRDLDVAGYLLVGLGVAVALVAGRGLGSLLRTGTVALAEPPPGMLRGLDGAVLAAALYFPLVRLVL